MTNRILPAYLHPSRKEVKEAIGLALGRASVAWGPVDGLCVFDSQTCEQLVDELMEIVTRFKSPRCGKLVNKKPCMRREGHTNYCASRPPRSSGEAT